LALDDQVQDYIPEFRDYGDPITINQLLSHTSRIRDQRGLLTLAGYKLDDLITHQDVLQLILSQTGLNFQPGMQFEYNHSNYTLLTQIINSISGLSLNEYMKEAIFILLEMHHTFFLDNSQQLVEQRAYSYEMHDGTYTKVNLNYENYGPTNLMTCVDDLLKWVFSFYTSEQFSEEVIAEFDAIATCKNGDEVLAATLSDGNILGCKGQFYRSYKGYDFYSHGGSLGGFKSFLGRFPEEQLCIIMLGNISHLETYSTALKIADIVLNIQSEEQKMEQIQMIHSKQKLDVEDDDQNISDEYVGSYYNEELNTLIRVQVINNHLSVLIGKKTMADVSRLELDVFGTKLDQEVTLEFLRNVRNDITSLKANARGVNGLIYEKRKA
jgi:CubicO group peptidase (beta-lactamase class C family)